MSIVTPVVPKSQQRQLIIDWDRLHFEANRLEPCQPVNLAANGEEVLGARYYRRDADGQIIEDFPGLCERVAPAIAKAEWPYGGPDAVNRWAAMYYDAMLARDFLPNSPCLMGAGTSLPHLFACFVVGVEDSIESILESAKTQALIQKYGGGTGFDLSELRPKDDVVNSTQGVSSGPCSFALLWDVVTAVIRQGGRRKGANMGVLRVDHPDIATFIDLKRDRRTLQNFNLSVGITDEFMDAVIHDKTYPLQNPRTGQIVKMATAVDILRQMAARAWLTGDPGALYLDTINRAHVTPKLGRLSATNPCGEQPLLPNEACVLGSINISNFVHNGQIDSDRLAYMARLAVRFLDDCIDASEYPTRQIREMVRYGMRRIGVGIMGWADALVKLGIPYGSKQALDLAEKTMAMVEAETHQASRELAAERGVFPFWEQSLYADKGIPMRNATLTSIAPTGTLSIIAGCSPSIEPMFALLYERHVLDGQTLTEANGLFIEHAKQNGYYSERLVRELKQKGSVAGIESVPPDARELFRTSLELDPIEHHLRMQAAFQKHTDAAVSKTVNLPNDATPELIERIYRTAWELGLKGTTVFRYGCLDKQVMNVGVGSDGSSKDAPTPDCPRGTCPA